MTDLFVPSLILMSTAHGASIMGSNIQREFIRRSMFELGVSQTAFGTLAGVHPNYIGAYMNGARDLRHDEFERVDSTIRDLKTLVRICEPIPLNFRNVLGVRELLNKFRAGVFDRRIAELEESEGIE